MLSGGLFTEIAKKAFKRVRIATQDNGGLKFEVFSQRARRSSRRCLGPVVAPTLTVRYRSIRPSGLRASTVALWI